MYFTDRGLEELADRRGEEQVTLAWLADQMQAFVDQFPDFEVPVERLATWLARGGTDDVDESDPAAGRGVTVRTPTSRRRADAWFWSLPAVAQLRDEGLALAPVTVLVGENGTASPRWSRRSRGPGRSC